MTTKTLSSGYIRKNYGTVIDSVLTGTVAIVQRYSRKLAVIISCDEYQRLKKLENTFLWEESRRIAEKNDREGTWLDEEEINRRMVERGVFTQEEMDALERRRKSVDVTVAN